MRIQSELHTDLEVYRLKGELLELREQNRVLREALEQAAFTICSEFCGSEHHHRECEIVQAALTATSQPGGTHEL